MILRRVDALECTKNKLNQLDDIDEIQNRERRRNESGSWG
jgi:hypothetical protein